jgi:hypothetical protein
MRYGVVAGIVAAALLVGAPALIAQGTTAKPADTKMSADAGARSLGSVRLTHSVKANGEVLRAGTYQVRLTENIAKPEAPGTQPTLERWVEFVQGGQVKGKEVVSIVPEAEIAKIAESKRVPQGSSRVEMLKGNEFVRVWINRAGTHYLIHMPPA